MNLTTPEVSSGAFMTVRSILMSDRVVGIGVVFIVFFGLKLVLGIDVLDWAQNLVSPTLPAHRQASSLNAPNPRATYDAVVAGKSCKQTSRGTLECDYRVGQSLYFTISSVG